MPILLKHKPKFKVKVNRTALSNRLIMQQQIEARVRDTQKEMSRIIIRASQTIKWEELQIILIKSLLSTSTLTPLIPLTSANCKKTLKY